jgi:hypothetical protein
VVGSLVVTASALRAKAKAQCNEWLLDRVLYAVCCMLYAVKDDGYPNLFLFLSLGGVEPVVDFYSL